MKKTIDNGGDSLSLFEQDQQKKEALALDSEITRIAENVSNLHALFKQMNEVVFEQGQIVDRIDYNIGEALVKTKKGNQHLVKVIIFLMFFRLRSMLRVSVHRSVLNSSLLVYVL